LILDFGLGIAELLGRRGKHEMVDARKEVGREKPFDASTSLSIDPEPFGLELKVERLCRRVD
jgi:hypothetical protein